MQWNTLHFIIYRIYIFYIFGQVLRALAEILHKCRSASNLFYSLKREDFMSLLRISYMLYVFCASGYIPSFLVIMSTLRVIFLHDCHKLQKAYSICYSQLRRLYFPYDIIILPLNFLPIEI